MKGVISLNGSNLTPEILVNKLSTGSYKIEIPNDLLKKIKKTRKQIVNRKDVVYGVNTGFGNFASVKIDANQTTLLQKNLIFSHCVGVGNPLTREKTRMLLALRINCLAKGYSGISVELLNGLVDCFNADLLPVIPEKGSVGASGDLAPLSHLAYGLMGFGKMWNPDLLATEEILDAEKVFEMYKVKPIKLGAKEGISLINGTQFISMFTCEAFVYAERLLRQADLIGASSHEAMLANIEAFDRAINDSRPHKGQIKVAKRLRGFLHNEKNISELYKSKKAKQARAARVQDGYSLRCIPQVHGVIYDIFNTVRDILSVEINSATDNPMILPDGRLVSNGNFHGEYPGKAADLLAIAIAELGSISERRTNRLMDPVLNKAGLPPFLVSDIVESGINSGFMITQYTAAALVSENKNLVNPATFDTIPTSNGQEDHVSMGAYAARKALEVVTNVERILGIELLASCQALDIQLSEGLTTTPILEKLRKIVRKDIPKWEGDRYMKKDIDTSFNLIHSGSIDLEPAEESYFIEPRIPIGTRDFTPMQMSVRSHVFNIIEKIYKLHGAVTIDTPIFELREILMGKYGEDSKLIYDLADQGEGLNNNLSLRYDLTVPFARYCAMNSVSKIKRYQIAKVYRRDQPIMSRGRYREFYQCDFDIAGNYGTSLLPDAECLQIMYSIYSALDLGDFVIKYNHRKLLDGMMEFCGVPNSKFRSICSAIDKLDKKPWEDIRKEMIEKGLSGEVSDKIGEFVAISTDFITIKEKLQTNEVAKQACDQVEQLMSLLSSFNLSDRVKFDITLARGLDYYTGVIFEGVLQNDGLRVGSIGGGGRYDGLIGMFSRNREIPSVGFSIGIERIFAILEKKLAAEKVKVSATRVLVASAGKDDLSKERFRIAQELWDAGIEAEILYSVKPKMKAQIEFCLDNQVDVMVVIGKDEVDKNVVNIKNISTKTQDEVPRSLMLEKIKELLK